MFRYDEALENAINKKELDKLLCGEGNYFYEDKLSSGPVDYSRALHSIYNKYNTFNNIAKEFVSSLHNLAGGTQEQVLHASAFLVFHLSFVDDEENTFSFDIKPVIEIIRNNVAKNGFSFEENNMRIIDYYISVLEQRGV